VPEKGILHDSFPSSQDAFSGVKGVALHGVGRAKNSGSLNEGAEDEDDDPDD